MKASSQGRRWFNIGIGLLFSGIFVWLSVRGVDWTRFSAELDNVAWRWVAAYFAVMCVAHLTRLFRWGLTVRAMGNVRWRDALAIGAVGQLAIFALPARLGELVRPMLVSDSGTIGFGQAGATVVVERIIDGLTMSLILFGTVLMLDAELVPAEFILSGYVATTVFVGLSVATVTGALAFGWIRGPVERAVGVFSQPLAARIVNTLQGFVEGLRILSSVRLAVGFFALTAVIWALSGLGIWVLFQAFGGSVASLPLVAAFATLSVLVVGIMIPAGPGTIGVFHWAVLFALGMFGVEESLGLLVATVLHLLIALVNLVWGVGGAWLGQISWARLLPRRVESEAR